MTSSAPLKPMPILHSLSMQPVNLCRSPPRPLTWSSATKCSSTYRMTAPQSVKWSGRYTLGAARLSSSRIEAIPLKPTGSTGKGNIISAINYLSIIYRVSYRHDLQTLFEELPVQFIEHTIIFGAYDNIIARFGSLGKILRGILQFLEKTPLKVFGLSHFWVIEKR